MSAYEKAGFKNVRLRDASAEFLGAVGGETNPETKRSGSAWRFLRSRTTCSSICRPGEWLLGQGTIYPDTIESGGTRESALIKTHHNRVPELLRRIEAGEIVEPLVQFYKDEVREIGRALGLPLRLIEKQPFPGPGSRGSLPLHRRARGVVGEREAQRSGGGLQPESARAARARRRRAGRRAHLRAYGAAHRRLRRAGASPSCRPRSPTRCATSIASSSGPARKDRSTSSASSRRRLRAKGSMCCARPTHACATSSPSTTRRNASGNVRS